MKDKITSSEEREIDSMLTGLDPNKSHKIITLWLERVSKHLSIPIWKVKIIAKRKGISI